MTICCMTVRGVIFRGVMFKACRMG